MDRADFTTRSSRERSPLKAVSFDVTGTLVHCPNLGAIYAEVLGRHGIHVAPTEVEAVFRLVWNEFSCSAVYGTDRFTSHENGASGWWRRFVERLCVLMDAAKPSRFAASELFDRFRRASAWEVYPEVPRCLEELAAAGYRLAIVSNWDHRLPRLLEELALPARFDTVVYSARIGVEKPHPRIFDAMVRELDLEPREVLHVGDRSVEDVEGARAAGIDSLLVDRASPPRRGAVADLAGLRYLLERREVALAGSES